MELLQLFKNLGQEMSWEKLSSIMEKYDKDESGQVGADAGKCVTLPGSNDDSQFPVKSKKTRGREQTNR